MSYARFGEDSDVYVYASSDGLECGACNLQTYEWIDSPHTLFRDGYYRVVEGKEITHVFKSNQEMIEHLEKHLAKGDAVPEYCFARLRDPEDEKKNQAYWEDHSGTI